MAIVVVDPKSLPERTVPIPGSKPPLSSLPYQDLGQIGQGSVLTHEEVGARIEKLLGEKQSRA